MSEYNDSGTSRCSNRPNDRMVAVEVLQRKTTKDYCWIGAQENIGTFSKS